MSQPLIRRVVPHQSVLPPLKSTGQHVWRRRLAPLLPLENTEFKFGGNNEIRININSDSEMLDGLKSYIKADFQVNTPLAGSYPSLDVGGIHACFREIELRSGNGATLQKYQKYNVWYAIMSKSSHRPLHVEYVEAAAGDSLGVRPMVPLDGDSWLRLSRADLISVSAADPAVVGSIHADDIGHIRVGDEVKINGLIDTGNNLTVAGEVKTVSAASITLDFSNLEVLDPGEIGSFYVRRRYIPQRAAVAQSAAKVQVTFRPAVSLLQMDKWLPLKYMESGIQLVLKLDRPEHVLNKGSTIVLDTTNTMEYTISNVRYVASFVTPDASLDAIYSEMFHSEEGIVLNVLSYDFDQRSFPASAGSIGSHFAISKEAARHVFAVMMSSNISESSGPTARNNNSISTFLDGRLDSYQFQVSGENYPYQPVACNNFSTEAFQQLMWTTNQMNGTLWNVRFDPSEWRRENVFNVSLSDAEENKLFVSDVYSKSFIMSTRFDRNDDAYTGIDLSGNKLQLVANRETAWDSHLGSLVLRVFVGHDTTIQISPHMIRRIE